jgi:hypothetical protein
VAYVVTDGVNNSQNGIVGKGYIHVRTGESPSYAIQYVGGSFKGYRNTLLRTRADHLSHVSAGEDCVIERRFFECERK